MIEQGDGSMQRLIDDGSCPKCHAAMDIPGRCKSCGLEIADGYTEEGDEDGGFAWEDVWRGAQ